MIEEITQYEGSYPPAENIDRVIAILKFLNSVNYIPIELLEITRRNPNQQTWIYFKQESPFAYHALKALIPESSKDDFKIMKQLNLIVEYEDSNQISSIKNFVKDYFDPIIIDNEYHEVRDTILTFMDDIDTGSYYTLSSSAQDHFDELIEDKATVLYYYLQLKPQIFGLVLNNSYNAKIDSFPTSKSLTDWIDEQIDSVEGRVAKHSKSSSVEAVNIRRWMTWFKIVEQYDNDYTFNHHRTNELIYRCILYLIKDHMEDNQISIEEIRKIIDSLSLNRHCFDEEISKFEKRGILQKEELERGSNNYMLIFNKETFSKTINTNVNFVYLPY